MYRTSSKSGKARRGRRPATPITRATIHSLVTVTASGCWEWNGSERDDGYGTNGSKYAHRESYEAFNGTIPNGLCVLHSCDNRICINPTHLSLGTDLDNMQDRDRKGRQAKGTAFERSKLTDNIVSAARREYAAQPFNISARARLLGVAPISLRRAIRGIKWKHVAAPAVQGSSK